MRHERTLPYMMCPTRNQYDIENPIAHPFIVGSVRGAAAPGFVFMFVFINMKN